MKGYLEPADLPENPLKGFRARGALTRKARRLLKKLRRMPAPQRQFIVRAILQNISLYGP